MSRPGRAVLLDDIEWSVRTTHALRAAGLVTVGDVLDYGRVKLLRTPNFGRKSLREVEEIVGPLPIGEAAPAKVDLSSVPSRRLLNELMRRHGGIG